MKVYLCALAKNEHPYINEWVSHYLKLGFDKIFGLNEDECNYVVDSLAYEGFITVNRQLFPATIIRISNSQNVISQMYSRLL